MGDTPEKKPEESQSLAEMDSATALQLYLDGIPVSSIPGIKSTTVLELKTGDTVKDAIHVMHEKNVCGALIADISTEGFSESDRFIGFIELSSLLLWCLEEIERLEDDTQSIESEDPKEKEKEKDCGILDLDQLNPRIAQTKIGELGKSFLWDPYFPVRPEDTLFHVLLLFSKHRLQVVPVVELSNSHVTGFITQNAVIHLLLQSSGLEWFDSIADKVISDFRFGSEEHVLQIYDDQNILEAFHMLWEKQMGAVAVISRESMSLIGCLRKSDVFLFLEKEYLLQNRKRLTVKEFISIESNEADSNLAVEGDQGARFFMSNRSLIASSLPKMRTPVTSKRVDTLKQVMNTMAEKNSSFSFLVDNSHRAKGILSLRDIITQFAPPCMDSTFQGGGFFETALEQTGCQVKNGTIVCNRTL